MKLRLAYFLWLLLLLPVFAFTWLVATESGLQWSFRQAVSYLPAGLKIEHIKGRLIGPVTLTNLEYQHNGTSIQAPKITLDYHSLSLLIGHIDITQLKIDSIDIARSEAGQSTTDTSLAELDLPWRISLAQAGIDQLNLRFQQQYHEFRQIRLDARQSSTKIEVEEFSFHYENLRLSASGDIQIKQFYQHHFKIDWKYITASNIILSAGGTISGDLRNIRINQQLVQPQPLSLIAELHNPLNDLSWNAQITADKFDSLNISQQIPVLSGLLKITAKGTRHQARISAELDQELSQQGRLSIASDVQLQLDKSLEFNNIELKHSAYGTEIKARASWDSTTRQQRLFASAEWKNLRWPLNNQPWLISRRGNGSIAGNPDNYQFNINTDNHWPGLIDSSWNMIASGNRNGIDVEKLTVTALNGKATASGKLSWSPTISWSSNIKINAIDPGHLWQQWDGELSGSFSNSGHYADGLLSINTSELRLKGKLRQQPVLLNADFNWQDNNIDIIGLELISGDSRLSASGKLGANEKLAFDFWSDNLAELYPDSQGSLQAEGSIRGSIDKPIIEASIKGQSLGFRHNKVETLDASFSIDLYHWQNISIDLNSEQARINKLDIASLMIDASNREISANFIINGNNIAIHINGRTDDNGWQGELDQLTVINEKHQSWKLKQASVFVLQDTQLSLTETCLTNSAQSSICISANHHNQTWSGQLSMKKFPLMMISDWFSTELKLDSLANGNAELHYEHEDHLTAKLHLELSTGSIQHSVIGRTRESWDFNSGHLDISIDEQGVKASSRFDIEQDSFFSAQLSLADAKIFHLIPETQPLVADIQFNMRDLDLLAALIPEINDLKGQLNGQISLAGTLASPRINGRFYAVNSSLNIPRLGISLEQIQFSSQTRGDNILSFKLEAVSGEGKIKISGRSVLNAASRWATTINIQGTDFEFSHIPEARIQGSPELTINIVDNTIDIQGTIDIPYAHIQPKDITTAARTTSDAVIIGRDSRQEEKWKISSNIRLNLGDRVHFYGFGFEGRLGGSLLLQDEPGQLTKATGTISIIDGSYRAYGQRLEIEHGRLIFTGGPLSSPGLDVIAVRKVNDVTAGFKVRGILRKPQLELFSTPAMGQTDALAYILLGGPVETATSEESALMAKATLALGLSGGDRLARSLTDRFGLDDMRIESNQNSEQISLVVGRYLSPKIYVSYGVGLMESYNTFNVRYQISKKWQLKAESGEHQGADIFYTIER